MEKFLKPAVNVETLLYGMAVAAKSKNTKNVQATTNCLKSISGRKILLLTNMHGNSSRIKVL